jgi:hypothetical protein
MKTIALIAACAALPAAAQEMPCESRSVVVELLAQNYGEVQVGYGFDPRGVIIEVFVSEAGTWSLLITDPLGKMCLLTAGTDWVFVEQPWPKFGEVN